MDACQSNRNVSSPQKQCGKHQHLNRSQRQMLIKEWKYLLSEYELVHHNSEDIDMFEGDKDVVILSKLKALRGKLLTIASCKQPPGN